MLLAKSLSVAMRILKRKSEDEGCEQPVVPCVLILACGTLVRGRVESITSLEDAKRLGAKDSDRRARHQLFPAVPGPMMNWRPCCLQEVVIGQEGGKAVSAGLPKRSDSVLPGKREWLLH